MSLVLNAIADFVLALLRPTPAPVPIPIRIDRRDRRR